MDIQAQLLALTSLNVLIEPVHKNSARCRATTVNEASTQSGR